MTAMSIIRTGVRSSTGSSWGDRPAASSRASSRRPSSHHRGFKPRARRRTLCQAAVLQAARIPRGRARAAVLAGLGSDSSSSRPQAAPSSSRSRAAPQRLQNSSPSRISRDQARSQPRYSRNQPRVSRGSSARVPSRCHRGGSSSPRVFRAGARARHRSPRVQASSPRPSSLPLCQRAQSPSPKWPTPRTSAPYSMANPFFCTVCFA